MDLELHVVIKDGRNIWPQRLFMPCLGAVPFIHSGESFEPDNQDDQPNFVNPA